jgi:maltose alpha-D-glucosyltransferase / alpha-amylase
MYQMYAQEPRMRVNVGIRRRLAPLLNNDIDRIKLMNSLLLSMPGSPIIYYGDEIGMGDNIYIGDRNGVRTPMQWSIDRNAGFSRADPQQLYLPLIMDPIYGYQAVNVEAQSRDPSSLLNWTRRILAVRRQHRAFGRGQLEFVRPQNRKVLAYVRHLDGENVLCVANLSQTAQAVELDLSKFKGRVPVEMMGRNAFPPIGELPYFLTLPAHGFFWLLLSETAEPPSWHIERMPATELPVLVLSEGLATFIEDSTRGSNGGLVRRTQQHLEQEVLPEFLRPRGWFAKHVGGIGAAKLGLRALWRKDQKTFLLSFVDVDSGERQWRYFLPLTIAWEDGHDSGALRTAEWTLAKVRERARAGVLIDAFADPAFSLGLVQYLVTQTVVPLAGGEVRFELHGELPAGVAELDAQAVSHVGSEPSNTNVVLGEQLFMKAYRRVESGPNPDIEMTRFLTQRGFPSSAALVGTLVYEREECAVLASFSAYVRNQGDIWNYALNHLERYTTELSTHDAPSAEEPHALFSTQMQTLGERIGEMHGLLASPNDDASFAPELIGSADLERWCSLTHDDAESALRSLQQELPALSDPVRELGERLLVGREKLLSRILQLCRGPVTAFKTRYHGNLHLAKVLLVADDLLITGFEGDTSLPIADRRRKDSPLYDVATLLRSFDYARGTALERAVVGRPELRERLEPGLAQWLEETSEAFLEGYRRGVAGCPCVPADEADLQRLITLFQIGRALRELATELDTRPEWAGVPLRALLQLLAANGD